MKKSSWMLLVAIGLAMLWMVGFTAAGRAQLEEPTPLTNVAFLPNRLSDPVVLTGADVPSLIGIPVGELVAWSYNTAWRQIPVQVDERAVLNIGQVSQEVLNRWQLKSSNFLLYTDPGTLTGPDPNPALDGDDEIVFMAADGDRPAPALLGEPQGVAAGSGVEVVIRDPLNGRSAYVYLFRQSGQLDPGAGQAYVDYQFNLLSGDYLTTYNFESGANPEDSQVTTSNYRVHFSDRWIQDDLNIYAGGANGVEILDRYKLRMDLANCSRTEGTFSKFGGGFVVNKSGPVRAIRSYIGANSGPFMQRTHLFYKDRQDIVTNVRVHMIPGLLDWTDFNANATGMTYINNLNPNAVTIDGQPDAVITGTLDWELAVGQQGALVSLYKTESDIAGFKLTSYYLDNLSLQANRYIWCSGDKFSYGTSGFWTPGPIPNTDPIKSAIHNHLMFTRIIYYRGPDAQAQDAQALDEGKRSPLNFITRAWPAVQP